MIPSLNSNFIPHELTNITIYEGDHPNEKGLYTSITHYSPPGTQHDFPDPIADRLKGNDNIELNYSYKLIE